MYQNFNKIMLYYDRTSDSYVRNYVYDVSSSRCSKRPFINAENDPDNPNDLPNAAQDPVSFAQWYQDGAGGFTIVPATTVLDEANYDDGSGVLAAVAPGNRFQIKRMPTPAIRGRVQF